MNQQENIKSQQVGSGEDRPMNFSELILGFASAALTYTGDSPAADGAVHKNLTLAKQNIDIIKLLKDKTAGNLDKDEQELIDRILIDLYQKFAESSR